MARDPDELLTTKQIAQELGVAQSTVYRWGIPHVVGDRAQEGKRTGDRHYLRREVDAWLAANTTKLLSARAKTTHQRISDLEAEVLELRRRLDAHELGHA